MSEPGQQDRARAVAALMRRLGITPPTRSNVRATNTRPPSAREVSREEFERIANAPRVQGIDVEIGEARMEGPDEAERAMADMSRTPGQRPASIVSPAARDASLLMAEARGEIPTEWIRGGVRGEAPEQIAARQQLAERRRNSSTLEEMYTFGERGADALPLGFGEELFSSAIDPFRLRERPRILPGPNGFTEEEQRAIDEGRALPMDPDNRTTTRRGLGHRGAVESERAEYLREREERSERNPVASGAGTFVGSLPAAALVPAPTAPTFAGRMLQATAAGGALGTVQGAGLSEAEDIEGRLRDAGAGGVYGMAGGAGGQLLGEGVGALLRPRVQAPRGGRDFTPDQRAAIDADPDLAAMDAQRARMDRRAANQRVAATLPHETPEGLESIARDYEGGLPALARDLDESGIARRGTRPQPDDVLARAESARRAPMVAGIDDARPGQFPDDEHVLGPARTAASDEPRVPARSWADDLPEDPADRVPFDPNDTLEAQMRAEFAREGRSTGASTQAGTAPRVRARRAGPEDSDGAVAARVPMSPGPRVQGIDDLPAPRPARDAVVLERDPVPGEALDDVDDGTFDFAEGMRAWDETPAGQLDEAGRARRRANILAAERRADRGGSSFATHDERTWPVDLRDVTAEPPPLPRRVAPEPAPAAPELDLGRWDAPEVTPEPAPPPSAPRTPGQRAGDVVAQSHRRAEIASDTAPLGGQGTLRERASRVVLDRFIRVPQQRAAFSEGQADRMAERIVRELQRRQGTEPAAAILAREVQRGPRAFGLALHTLMSTRPEVAEAATPILINDSDFVPAGTAPASSADVETDADDDGIPDYVHPSRRQ